ncbi:hypothetical protein AB0H34_23975 [Saccharopolyspora shandongensis]|uniref:hypothetical protein n=1 Tax=Saccharopolyspora shandongensis TaxID=418495 RepID=UPI0033DD675F
MSQTGIPVRGRRLRRPDVFRPPHVFGDVSQPNTKNRIGRASEIMWISIVQHTSSPAGTPGSHAVTGDIGRDSARCPPATAPRKRANTKSQISNRASDEKEHHIDIPSPLEPESSGRAESAKFDFSKTDRM